MRYKACRYNGKRMRLHIAVFLAAHGLASIPQGKVIHHADFDKTNNAIENLVCMTKQEHDRIHSARMNRDSMGRFCKESEVGEWEEVNDGE